MDRLDPDGAGAVVHGYGIVPVQQPQGGQSAQKKEQQDGQQIKGPFFLVASDGQMATPPRSFPYFIISGGRKQEKRRILEETAL